MADFYERMQGTATKLIGKFKQGSIIYLEKGAETGDPWNPQAGADIPHVLKATARGVSKEYIDNTTILDGDLMLSVAVFDTEPEMSGRISIDGRLHEIVKIIRLPSAGTIVSWSIIVRG